MIIEIFLVFSAIAFLLSIVGFYLKQELLIIFGFLVFGLLSFPLLNGELEFRDGSNVTVSFNYNGTQLMSSSNQIDYSYTTYTNTVWYGIFYLFIAIGGLFMWYRGFYGGNKDED